MGAVRRTASNIAWLGVDRVVQVTAAVVTSALLARALGVQDFGMWQFAISVVFVTITSANIAGADVIAPILARRPERSAEVVAAAWAIRVAACLIAGLSFSLAVWLILQSPRMSVLIALLSVCLVREPYAAVTARLIADGRARFAALISIATVSTRLLATVAVFAAGGAIFALTAPIWLEAVIFVAVMSRAAWLGTGSRHLSARVVRLVVARATPMWFVSFLMVASLRADRLILNQLLPADQYGLYAAAAQVTDNWYFVAQILVLAAAPTLVYGQPTRVAIKNASLVALLALAACAFAAWVFSAWAPVLIEMLFGTSFVPAAALLQKTIWPTMLIVATLPLSLIAVAQGHIWFLALKWLAVLIVVGVLLFVFGRDWGAMAALVAYSAGFGCALVVDIVYLLATYHRTCQRKSEA